MIMNMKIIKNNTINSYKKRKVYNNKLNNNFLESKKQKISNIIYKKALQKKILKNLKRIKMECLKTYLKIILKKQ